MSTSSAPSPRIALIGAGITSAVLAHRLLQQGCSVKVFEKARGAGGRMSTRRSTVSMPDGRSEVVAHDHGAPALQADGDADWLDQIQTWQAAGWLQPWDSAWVPVSEMPALCKHLLAGATVHPQSTVLPLTDAQPANLSTAEGQHHGPFDAVVITAPPPQAAALVGQLRPDWSAVLSTWPQRPTWALMVVTHHPAPSSERPVPPIVQPNMGGCLTLAAQDHSVLSRVERSDVKPGRGSPSSNGLLEGGSEGSVCTPSSRSAWVVHASPAWSAWHVHHSADEVRAELLAYLAQRWPEHFGHGQVVQAQTHRWLYGQTDVALRAQQRLQGPEPTGFQHRSAWDPELCIGVAGDAWDNGTIAGAWRSAQEMARRLTDQPPSAASQD